MLDAFSYLLCSKLCWHNWLVPRLYSSHCGVYEVINYSSSHCGVYEVINYSSSHCGVCEVVNYIVVIVECMRLLTVYLVVIMECMRLTSYIV